MSKDPFEDRIMAIKCSDPECRHMTVKTIGWIRRNSNVQCPDCGSNIDFTAEPFLTRLKNFEDEYRKFLKTFRDVYTDIKI